MILKSIFLKIYEGSVIDTERQRGMRSSILRFTPQMSITARARPDLPVGGPFYAAYQVR